MVYVIVAWPHHTHIVHQIRSGKRIVVVRQKPLARANALAAARRSGRPVEEARNKSRRSIRATNFPLKDETSGDRRSCRLDDDVLMVVPPKRLFSSESLAEKRVRN